MNKKMEKLARKLAPKIAARMGKLTPAFPAYVMNALISAELSFRLQGGCGNMIEVHTTEDGMFLTPMPEDVQSIGDIQSHLQCVIEAKPGVSSASFACVSAPEGEVRSLICLFLIGVPRNVLHVMTAPITGPRTLGEWSITKCHKVRTGNVMPRVITALRKCRHSLLSVSNSDRSEHVCLLIDEGKYSHAQIDEIEASPSKAIQRMMEMVDENIDGGPDLVVTAIDEGDCKERNQQTAVWGFGFIGGKIVPVESQDFSDLASLFNMADDSESV
jgi:hypothetical protein